MRTKAGLITGSGKEPFVKYLKSLYPAGGICVIYENKDLAYAVVKELGNTDYRFYLYTIKEVLSAKLPDCVRLIIGIGKGETVSAVKNFADNRKTVFYAEEICCEYFLSLKNCFAEAVYFDSDKCNLKRKASITECYVSTFALYTELRARAYYESNLPFADKGLNGLISAMRTFLLIGADKDNYLSEGLRLIKAGIDYFIDKGINEYYVFNVAKIYGGGTQNLFLTAYFINLTLFVFTKWDFRDILIPSENIIELDESESFGRNNTFMPTREELHLISAKVKAVSKLPNIDFDSMLTALRDGANKDTPLFAEINNRGIIEGIFNYDGFEGH